MSREDLKEKHHRERKDSAKSVEGVSSEIWSEWLEHSKQGRGRCRRQNPSRRCGPGHGVVEGIWILL